MDRRNLLKAVTLAGSALAVPTLVAPAFPFAGGSLAPLRAKAEAEGSGDFTNLWSGQSARLSPRLPSGQLTERFAADALSHFSRLAASTQ